MPTMFRIRRRGQASTPTQPAPLFIPPDPARLTDLEREAHARWVPPPPSVRVFHFRRRLIVERMDETWMGIGIAAEPRIMPDDLDDASLGTVILEELDGRSLDLPSPTRRGWAVVDSERLSRLGAHTLKVFQRESSGVLVARDDRQLVCVTLDGSTSATQALATSKSVQPANPDPEMLGRLARELLGASVTGGHGHRT